MGLQYDYFKDLCSEFSHRMEEMRRELGDELKTGMKKVFAEMFEEYPELISFDWRQATPAFNDGDPCEFTVHPYGCMVFKIDGYAEFDYGDYADHEVYGWEETEQIVKENGLDKIHDKVYSFIESVPDFAMEGMFGDGAHITVNRDGITEEEYDDC